MNDKRRVSLEAESDQGLVEIALSIAKKRRATLTELKAAIRNRDLEEADRLITELVPDGIVL
jgi:hypothetical protein